MQKVVIIPEAEFNNLLARIEKLEASAQACVEPEMDKVYSVREAARYLVMTPEGVRVARRQKRLKGFRLNEKCWGFYHSELDRYKKCYDRL